MKTARHKFSRERCHGPGFSMCIFVFLFDYLWGLFSDACAQSRTFGRGVRLHFDFCFAVASRCSRLLGELIDPCW